MDLTAGNAAGNWGGAKILEPYCSSVCQRSLGVRCSLVLCIVTVARVFWDFGSLFRGVAASFWPAVSAAAIKTSPDVVPAVAAAVVYDCKDVVVSLMLSVAAAAFRSLTSFTPLVV